MRSRLALPVTSAIRVSGGRAEDSISALCWGLSSAPPHHMIFLGRSVTKER
eukprot:CAMPEP_0196167838 /NCGR_PEP_ID=MMETSP0911-20130528/2865_1 /TAXON_ID=49265 /ORGANISM="Thalassiosira rotula, Strain GSO102" /LENGTH=50 /DNA_ID=CAMNT_0041433767 /DNA_START=314 /DNA_END=462 /DNA_ORIENTATION=+